MIAGRELSNSLSSSNLVQRMTRALLATDAFPDLPIPIPVPRKFSDYPTRILQVLSARVTGRNPAAPPWRRRAVDRWHCIGPGPGPNHESIRRSPLLIGVTAVWNEDDVIFATVRNLFDQGADHVFVIDDASDDATAQEATAAGASVVLQKNEGIYREADRCAKIQKLIHDQTAALGGDVWWLVVDADEFPRGPGNTTIRGFIQTLPSWVDTVGSRVLDHWPSEAEGYVRREHPLNAFPLAQRYHWPWCRNGHWKHQLMRVRTPGDLVPMPGHHTVRSADGRRVREYPIGLLMHHFAIRNRQRTEAKLRRSTVSGGRYDRSPDTFTRWRIAQRLRSLDNIYAGRFDLVPNCFPGEPKLGLTLRDWRQLAAEDDTPFGRGTQ